MKTLSLSISGSGTVSDELAAKVEDVAAGLRSEASSVYVSVAVTDAPPAAPATEAGAQAP